MPTKKQKISVNKYNPGVLLITGVVINIIFASIMSFLLPLVVITIPAIVLNALLLVPRIDTKRHYAYWRIIPVILILLLTTIIAVTTLLVVGGLTDFYDSFATFVDKWIIFWTSNPVFPDSTDVRFWTDVAAIILAVIGGTGSGLTLFGWYSKKEIGVIEAPIVETKKTNESKTTEKKPSATKSKETKKKSAK